LICHEALHAVPVILVAPVLTMVERKQFKILAGEAAREAAVL
jgi:hypothetical protein